MHDAKGRPLKVGDRIMVPATITSCGGDENYCAVSAETVAHMPGNGYRTSVGPFSTKQVLRANEGDDVGFEVAEEGGITKLV